VSYSESALSDREKIQTSSPRRNAAGARYADCPEPQSSPRNRKDAAPWMFENSAEDERFWERCLMRPPSRDWPNQNPRLALETQSA
jgi:hypothetical protein